MVLAKGKVLLMGGWGAGTYPDPQGQNRLAVARSCGRRECGVTASGVQGFFGG